MTNSKLNKKVKELAKTLGFSNIVKNIKVRSTTLEELAGYVILMANYMSVRFEANNEQEKSDKVMGLLRMFLVQINFCSVKQFNFPNAA